MTATQPQLPRLPGSYPTPLGDRHDPYFGLRHLQGDQLAAVCAAESSHLAAQRLQWSQTASSMSTQARAMLSARPDLSYPTPHHDWILFSRTAPQAERPVHYLAPATADIDRLMGDDLAEAVILLDEEVLAADRGTDGYTVGGLALDRHATRAVYADCPDGSEKYALHVRDLARGTELDGPTGCSSYVDWWGGQVLYLTLDEQMRPNALHLWDVESGTDTIVHTESDERLWMGFGVSHDEQWVTVVASGHDMTRSSILTRTPDGAVRYAHESDLQPGVHVFGIAEGPVTAWLYDRADGVSYVADAASGDVLVPARDGVQLQQAHCDGLNIIAEARTIDGLRVEVWGDGGFVIADIDIVADCTVRSIDPRSGAIQVCATGWTDLERIYRLDPSTGRTALLHREEIAGLDPDSLVAQRLMLPARDGVDIPVTVVRRADATGAAPAVVYAYGAYGLSLDPWFSVSRYLFVQEGAAFVAVHARGGGEGGRAWHEAGRRDAKMTTFHDVIDAVAALRERGIVTEVVLSGGSAGGGTVSTVANLDPSLACGVIADVPFVDAMATMSDATLPLTVGEYDEWGDASTAEGLAWIARWSAVDNIATGVAYPPFYVAVGLHDPRVGFWEGLKLAARLRDAHPQNMVVVRVDEGAGHAGATGRWAAIDQACDEWAFALHRLDLIGPAPQATVRELVSAGS